jgi:hypothetical protein
MVDIDPALDTKLRAFFERIEASPAPPGLTNVDVTAPARGRRSINLLAGVAAAAVVAGSVAVFAIALRSHEAPAASTTPRASPSTSTLPPSSASALKTMPMLGAGGIPASAHEVIAVTRGQGSVLLQRFVPQGTLYIQFDCAGPGGFKIASTDHVVGNDLTQCSSSFGVTTLTVGTPRAYDAAGHG